MPPNLQEVKLKFARRRSAKVMGTLADRDDEPQEGEEVEGIMVTNNLSSKIVAPEDLAIYTPLRLGSISSKLHVPFCGTASTFELFLKEMYRGVKKFETAGVIEGDETPIIKFELNGGKVSPFFFGRLFPQCCLKEIGSSSGFRHAWSKPRCGNRRVGSKPRRGCHCRFCCRSFASCTK